MKDTECLKRLALMGGTRKSIKISARQLQPQIEASSKTVAKRLKMLEEGGLIERMIVPGGQSIKLTEKGIQLLKREYAQYKLIFSDDPDWLDMEGRVISGLGEGQYYINLPGYREQFEEALHIVPFPGTLNLQLTRESMGLREKLNEMPAVLVRGFSDGERTYGGGRCHPVMIGDIKAAIVIPDRSHYPEDLIELIAPVNLRETLSLKDGDALTIRVDLPDDCP